jgi:hypothetical protein
VYERTREPVPKKVGDGRQYLSPASYTLSKEEKESMFECLNSIKVPSSFSSNVKGIINVAEKIFLNLNLMTATCL